MPYYTKLHIAETFLGKAAQHIQNIKTPTFDSPVKRITFEEDYSMFAMFDNVLVGPLNVKTSTMSSITHLNSPTFHTEYTPENYSSYYLVQLVF